MRPDLELRRQIAEALGWTRIAACGREMIGKPPVGFAMELHLSQSLADGFREVPAYECDPAVSEPAFMEWCSVNGWAWELWNNISDGLYCAQMCRKSDVTQIVYALLGSDSPSVARAKAWLQAIQQMKGGPAELT